MLKMHPYNMWGVITPSDTVNIPWNNSRIAAIYVGVAGDVTVVNTAGQTALFKAVPAGTLLPVEASRVNATGTTATNLIALYNN